MQMEEFSNKIFKNFNTLLVVQLLVSNIMICHKKLLRYLTQESFSDYGVWVKAPFFGLTKTNKDGFWFLKCTTFTFAITYQGAYLAQVSTSYHMWILGYHGYVHHSLLPLLIQQCHETNIAKFPCSSVSFVNFETANARWVHS